MPYCSKCGVEVETHKTHCPLCQTKIQEIENLVIEDKKKYPDQQVLRPKKIRTKKQKRILAWEIISVTLLLPLLITLFIDLIFNKAVSWSLYPISTLILVWIIITIPLLFTKNLPVLLVGETVPYFIYFLVVDLINNGKLDWYLRLGIPIISTVLTTAIAIAIGSIYMKHKGANIAALIVLGIGVVCVVIDFTITSYISEKWISWSLYVIASTIVVSGFLFYIHFRIIRGSNLKRKLQM
jgi:hypothetical protein